MNLNLVLDVLILQEIFFFNEQINNFLILHDEQTFYNDDQLFIKIM
jgi:hypothetical protein